MPWIALEMFGIRKISFEESLISVEKATLEDEFNHFIDITEKLLKHVTVADEPTVYGSWTPNICIAITVNQGYSTTKK